MSELKLVLGPDGEPDATAAKADLSKLNPMDALNRRDIELIKRSLANMHRDGAELRETIVSLHARHSQAPSRGFFIGLSVIGFLAIGVLTTARPNLDAVLQHIPVLSKQSAAATQQ
jgi:hypothetical protein